MENLYPNLEWTFGILGENLTVSGLDETQIHVGDIYKIGEALVQVTQPREPCYKFGVKFGTQAVLKQFIEHGFPRTYVKVQREGFVKLGDEVNLVQRANDSLTIFQFFKLLYAKDKNQKHLMLAIKNDAIPQSKREKFSTFIKQ